METEAQGQSTLLK
uniref:Uncharacterized protein n=1 Tax=Lepeophtheirus salmonis TaxID=72036 RepID=A0A0K2V1M3_LEPSM